MSELAIFEYGPLKYSRQCTDLSYLFYSYHHFTHNNIMKNNPDVKIIFIPWMNILNSTAKI